MNRNKNNVLLWWALILRTFIYSFLVVRRKTIFEYHRVQFDKKDLKNGTVIYLKPLPSCQSKTTCESCLAKDANFEVSHIR